MIFDKPEAIIELPVDVNIVLNLDADILLLSVPIKVESSDDET